MRLRVLSIVLVASTALAQDVAHFYVDCFVKVLYPDGTTATINKERAVTIEGFSCAVNTSFAPDSYDYYGPGIECLAPEVGKVAAVARCDVRAPGSANSTTLQLLSVSSPDKVYTQVTLSCETTYTKVQPTKPPASKKRRS